MASRCGVACYVLFLLTYALFDDVIAFAACYRTLDTHASVVVTAAVEASVAAALSSGAAANGTTAAAAAAAVSNQIPASSFTLARRACKAVVAADSGNGKGAGCAGDQVLAKAAMQWAVGEEGNGMLGFIDAVGNCGDAVEAADKEAAIQLATDAAAKPKEKGRATAAKARERVHPNAENEARLLAASAVDAKAAAARAEHAKIARAKEHAAAVRVAKEAHAKTAAAAARATASAKRAPALSPPPPVFSAVAVPPAPTLATFAESAVRNPPMFLD